MNPENNSKPRGSWLRRIAIALAVLVIAVLFWPPQWWPTLEPRYNTPWWVMMLASPPMVGEMIDPDGRSITPSYYTFDPGFANTLEEEIVRRGATQTHLRPRFMIEEDGRMLRSAIAGIWGSDPGRWGSGEAGAELDPFAEGPMPWMLGSEVLFANRDGSAAFSIEVEGGEGSMRPIPAFREGLCPVPTGVRDSQTAFAAMADDGTMYDPLVELTRYGFVRPDGSWAIEPYFEDALRFHEGLAAVQLDGRWGFVGKDGQFAIAPRFRRAHSFSEGLAAASTGGSDWGYIRPDGSWAIEPRFKSAGPFSEGLAPAGESEPTRDSWRDRTKWGFIDPSGEWVIEPRFYGAEPFSSGRAPVAMHEFSPSSGAAFAYIDRSGEVVIPGPFAYASPFQDGEAMIMRPVTLARWIFSANRTRTTYYGTVSYGIDEDFELE